MPRKQKRKSRNQVGGTSTGYGQLFYAQTAVGGPAQISAVTESVINQVPLFNPFSTNTVIPGSSGIIPTGTYLMAQGQTGGGLTHGSVVQTGGGEYKVYNQNTNRFVKIGGKVGKQILQETGQM